MAFNFATVCMKDDPTTTPQDVVNLKMHMDKQRLIMHEGMQVCRFVVISDYSQQDFVDAQGPWADDPNNDSPARFITAEPLPEGVDPSFAIRNVFKNELFSEHDKTMYCHPRCIPMELTHGIMYSSLPDKGDPSHTSYTLSDEDKASITDNNYAVLNLALDWTKTEPTMFLPYFFQFVYEDHEELTKKMFNTEVISKYETFMHFIEGEYDEFVLPFLPATIGKYYCGDRSKNNEIIDAYEENRETIEANWRGTGGEPDAKYISWDHDYRSMTKQTSLVYFDETKCSMNEDYWARMRLL